MVASAWSEPTVQPLSCAPHPLGNPLLLPIRLLTIVCLLFGTMSAQGQWTEGFFDSRDSVETVAIKGKMLPWMVIGMGINYTLGAEYSFKHVNSLELLAVYNDWSAPAEKWDTTSLTYVPAPRTYVVSRALFFSYKRYFNWHHKKSPNPIRCYAGPFVRYGKNHEFYQEGTPTNYIKFEQLQYSAGGLVGVLLYWGDNVGVDLSMGGFYKIKDTDETYYQDDFLINRQYRTDNWGFRIGVNVSILLRRN